MTYPTWQWGLVWETVRACARAEAWIRLCPDTEDHRRRILHVRESIFLQTKDDLRKRAQEERECGKLLWTRQTKS